MNFTNVTPLEPLKVVVNNCLSTGAKTLVFKILAGRVFGARQPINLILLVYDNEKPAAEVFKQDLLECAFFCTSSILITSDLSRLRNVDIFCIITNFSNPNWIDLSDDENSEIFHTTYFLLKVANFMKINSLLVEPLPPEEKKWSIEKFRKPIVVTDGLVSLDILATFASNVPNDIFYCPSPLPSLARAALAKYMKLACDELNDFLVWAVNDDMFYIEIEKPIVRTDIVNMSGPSCEWKLMSEQMMTELKLDHTSFSSSLLKKDLHDKVRSCATENTYSDLYRASKIAETLKYIWSVRNCKKEKMRYACSLGVVSDGSFGTLKRMPYVLPVVFKDDCWFADERIEDQNHLDYDLKKMNKALREHHKSIMAYCKRF